MKSVRISGRRQHLITPHSRIGLTPSVADVGSGKRVLRQLPPGVRECEERYLKDPVKDKRTKKTKGRSLIDDFSKP
jgi:hypothetical protein